MAPGASRLLKQRADVMYKPWAGVTAQQRSNIASRGDPPNLENNGEEFASKGRESNLVTSMYSKPNPLPSDLTVSTE